MEDSQNSSSQHQEEEESGWTAYLQESEYSSYSSLATSMVSDAASRAAWKALAKQNLAEPTLRLKKTRTKVISHDDSLEDTASSPVNSPKVSDALKPAMNPKTQEDNISLGKGIEPGLQMGQTTSDHQKMTENDSSDNNHLKKKKGLCLVPMSMLVNYFG